MQICKGAPIVSHLLFTYDSFLFFRVDERERMAMRKILKHVRYEDVPQAKLLI